MVAFALSLLVATGLWALQRPISSLAPKGQARLLFVAALLPFCAASAVLTAALAPSFGWIRDHYDIFQVHSHPHLCVDHSMDSWPTFSLIGLAAILSLRVTWTAVGRIGALYKASSTQKMLMSASDDCPKMGLRILPIDEAQAFVLGLIRPTLYITRGLFSGDAKEHLDAVVAHERAHIRRTDPLRRFVAGMAGSFHFPGIGHWIDTKHARAQEMAADELACTTVGNRQAVASALVALAKAQFGHSSGLASSLVSPSTPPPAALAFSRSDVQDRVLLLLDDPKQRDWPRVSWLLVGATVALLGVALTADAVHHQVEYFLGVLGN